jgi:hypothetical protein
MAFLFSWQVRCYGIYIALKIDGGNSIQAGVWVIKNPYLGRIG